jgi:hypothetical protein
MGNVNSKERLFSRNFHAYLKSSDESNIMASQSQDQAVSNDHFSMNALAYKSETVSDENTLGNESMVTSSNGARHPAGNSMYTGPTEITAVTALAPLAFTLTTVMIRNLPRQCVPKVVAAEIDRSGFAEGYDFISVPTIFKRGSSNRFGFVNFISPEMAIAFRHEWNRSWRFREIGPPTKVNVVFADIQGLQANMAKWGEHALVRVKNPAFKPLMPSN